MREAIRRESPRLTQDHCMGVSEARAVKGIEETDLSWVVAAGKGVTGPLDPPGRRLPMSLERKARVNTLTRSPAAFDCASHSAANAVILVPSRPMVAPQHS